MSHLRNRCQHNVYLLPYDIGEFTFPSPENTFCISAKCSPLLDCKFEENSILILYQYFRLQDVKFIFLEGLKSSTVTLRLKPSTVT